MRFEDTHREESRTDHFRATPPHARCRSRTGLSTYAFESNHPQRLETTKLSHFKRRTAQNRRLWIVLDKRHQRQLHSTFVQRCRRGTYSIRFTIHRTTFHSAQVIESNATQTNESNESTCRFSIRLQKYSRQRVPETNLAIFGLLHWYFGTF